jgi:hypothetical protein
MVQQQAIVSLLLVQHEFTEFPESTLHRLETVYERQRAKDYKQELQRLKAIYKLNPESGTGGLYGKFPRWKNYRVALEKARTVAPLTSDKPCNSCGEIPSINQCEPCKHIFCKTCTAEFESEFDSDAIGNCIICNVEVDKFVSVDGDEDESSDDVGKETNKREIPPECCWASLDGIPPPSSKGIAAKLQILDWLHEDPSVKIVLFTQFLDMQVMTTSKSFSQLTDNRIEHLAKMCKCEKWRYTTVKASYLALDSN